VFSQENGNQNNKECFLLLLVAIHYTTTRLVNMSAASFRRHVVEFFNIEQLSDFAHLSLRIFHRLLSILEEVFLLFLGAGATAQRTKGS